MNHNLHRSSHHPSHHQRHPSLPSPPSHPSYLFHHHPPEVNFVNSHSHRFSHDDFPQFDRRRFDFREPRVSPILNRQVHFSDCLLSPTPPPPFVDCVDRFSVEFRSPRFIEEFDVDRGFRFGYVEEERRDYNVVDRDELRGVRVYDERRSVDELRRNVVYDNLRNMNDFEREELLRHRIDERGRIIEDLNRRELLRNQNRVAMDELVCDRFSGEQMIMKSGLYHREVFRESELISGGADFVFGVVIDKVRPYRDENVPVNLVRRGSFDVRCDDVSRYPMEFRGREFEARERFPVFYTEEINRGFYNDRGRRETERGREDLKYSPRKKSAFCRLQPPAVQHTSTSRNKLDKTTASSRKGKGINVKGLGHRSSSEKKVGSSVDLDVSFKSNALVSKPIIGTTSSSGVEGSKNVRVSDFNTRIDSESAVKAQRSRNHGKNSPVPKNEEKQPDNLVKSSPVLMKVGIRKVAEVPDNSSSKSFSSGSSSLSGGCNTSSTATLDGEFLSKGDKRAGLCEASLPSDRKKRKAVNLISRVSSSVATNADTGVFDVDDSFNSPSGGSLELGCVQDEQRNSNLDDALPKSVEKCTSDVNAKKGPVEPMVVSVGDNVDKIDVCYGRIHSHDSLATTSSVTHDGDASIMTESRAYSTSSDGNVYELHGLLPGCDIIGQECSDVCMDDDKEAEMMHSGDGMQLVYSPSIDVSNGDFHSTDCMKLTTISDIEVTNTIWEQHCTGQGSFLVDGEARKRRKLSWKACGPMGGNLGNLPLSVKKDVLPLNVKRKARIEDCNVDPKYYSCNCTKRRKSIPLDPVFIDTFVSDSCDLCASGNALKFMATGSLHSVSYSEQPTGGFEFYNSVPPENVAGEATTSLATPITILDSSSKAEVQHTNSQVEEITQVSCIAESWCNRKDGDVVMGSDRDLEIAKNCQQRTVHCIQPNHTAHLDGVPLITDVDYESNINVEVNVAAIPNRPFLCTEPTDEIVTSKPDVLTNPLGVFFHGASTFDISSPAIHTTYDNIIFGDDNKSGSSKCLETLMSQSNLVHGGFQKNVKPTNSAAPSNQSFTQKAASVPSKHSKNVLPIPSSMSRRFSWRNELIHGKTPISSSQASPITTYSKKSLASTPAKPRTWNRFDSLAAADTDVKMPSSCMAPPQRPPYGKSLKVQDTSYIRKGNSLVRNPASSTLPLCPRGLLASINQEKPIVMNKNGNIKGSRTNNSSETPDCMIIGRHALREMPKVNPLSCTEKTPDCNIASVRDYTSPLQVERFDGMDNRVALYSTESASSLSRNSEMFLDGSLEDAGNLSDEDLQASRVKSVVYIKRKANQLIAASTPIELSGHNMDINLGLSSDNSYYKRRKNQLIRASSESNIQKMVSAADDSSYSRRERALDAYSGRSASKGSSKQGVKSLKVSLVWKLGDAKPTDKGCEPSRQLLSHLLPWKRTAFRRSMWRASSVSSCISTSIKTSRKLLSSKNHTLVYKRSGRGFSLRRSKVISLAGSLKWSKSMEKRSKKVEEEATLAVDASDSTSRQSTGASGVTSESVIRKFSSHKSAHGLKLHPGERIFRFGVFKYRMDPSRRTLQRIPDKEAPDSTTSRTEKYAKKSYMPKRLLVGSNEYVRIGNGNQLVRDPKRRTRILASEKVRWSLHTARLRLAKKRKFCQFFTRFGRCNKSEGKCPYIHDSSKINVCTKFLKGLCIDPNCKLTHKVIPDRMPDCSFFLQGLCSHESCPYRHVNVHPNATICESFLRGYCAEGNECQKKHSYLCPEFEATGSCPQGSDCKLYHPKKGTSKKGKILEDQGIIRGRYFDPGLTAAVTKPENDTAILEKAVAPKNGNIVSGGDLGDYISLDVNDDELGESIFTNCEVTCSSKLEPSKNRDLLSRGVLGDYMDLVVEAGENKYPNREVVYLSEFDVLNSLPGDVDE